MKDKKSEIDKAEAEVYDHSTAVVTKKSKFKYILLIVFIAMILKIVLTPKGPELQWLDYESGTKLAKQENKPILIAFYKAGTRFCTDMWNHTYTNEKTIQFIEANFVPILVDVNRQSDLAKEYDVGYYPTHFIKTPDNKEIIITRRGYDTPGQFRPFLIEGLKRMELEPR